MAEKSERKLEFDTINHTAFFFRLNDSPSTQWQVPVVTSQRVGCHNRVFAHCKGHLTCFADQLQTVTVVLFVWQRRSEEPPVHVQLPLCLRFCSLRRNCSMLCCDVLRGSLNTMQMRTQTKWSHATWQNSELWRGEMEAKEEMELETDMRRREKGGLRCRAILCFKAYQCNGLWSKKWYIFQLLTRILTQRVNALSLFWLCRI